MNTPVERLVRIRAEDAQMEGLLALPSDAQGVVLFAHGSGSSRHSPRNNAVACVLRGSRDEEVLELNRTAFARLPCSKELSVVAGATHLFEEAGTLDAVAEQAAAWFSQHMRSLP
jgi:hypothetical protein